MTTTKALVLPADVPPRRTSIKRQLLFFDSVLLVDPEADFAVLNQGEIVETFPNGRIMRWGEYGSYSRAPNYVEEYRVLFAETQKLQAQGKIRVLKPPPSTVMDPRFNWISSVAASHDELLVRAALPDYKPGANAYYRKYGGWYNAAIPRDKNYESVHTWMVHHHEMREIDIEWNQVAWVRVGRALKSLRRAGLEGAVPLAIDSINQNICLALGSRAYHHPPSASDLATHAIALDAVDPLQLDEALVEMTWDEVMRLRKEVLPHVAKLRQVLVDSVVVARKPQNADLEVYIRALAEIKEKHKKAAGDARDAWTKLKFKTLDAGAAAISGGLSTIAPPGGWAPVLLGIAGAFIGKMAQGTAADLHKLVVTSKARKTSPLFFFDVLPEMAERIAREDNGSDSGKGYGR